jgi:predicted Fe-Mo cluster-binding NifX family protein
MKNTRTFQSGARLAGVLSARAVSVVSAAKKTVDEKIEALPKQMALDEKAASSRNIAATGMPPAR